jgi:hypothetical protein
MENEVYNMRSAVALSAFRAGGGGKLQRSFSRDGKAV